jgi:hypothetical protein
VARRQDSIISFTEYPVPVPRLKASNPESLLCKI